MRILNYIKTKLRSRRSQAMVLMLLAITFLAILSRSFLAASIQDKDLVERQIYDMQLFYLAEGAMEDTIKQFKEAIANYQVSATTPVYPVSGNVITNFSSTSSMPGGATASTIINEAEAGERTITDPDGINIVVKNYQVTTTVEHPLNNTFTLTLNRIITRRLIYTFQHAVFYEDDLEVLPGPNMTFSGRVHSNSDIYLGANNTLTIDSEYMRSTGDILNQRKDNGSVPAGNVSIKETGTTDYYDMAGLDSNDANWMTESQTRWGGTVRSSVHGVNELTVPEVASIQVGQYYDSNAGIRIENTTISKGGSPLVEGVDIPPGTITSTTTLWNNREQKWVKMTEVDMNKLGGGDFGGTIYPNQLETSNGLIYATTTNLGIYQAGVRLNNGAEIKRTDGVTVVSDNPVYVKGDYNTTTKKPTAVIADALNILSNNWHDANSSGSVNGRSATETSINTAFIAGIDTTVGANYNGGLENYPRMHENWSGTNLNIQGSFVAIWNSQVATGAWQYGDPQYTAPGRNWSYDTDFQNGTMPPFTPWAVEVQKGAWWKS